MGLGSMRGPWVIRFREINDREISKLDCICLILLMVNVIRLVSCHWSHVHLGYCKSVMNLLSVQNEGDPNVPFKFPVTQAIAVLCVALSGTVPFAFTGPEWVVRRCQRNSSAPRPKMSKAVHWGDLLHSNPLFPRLFIEGSFLAYYWPHCQYWLI